MIETTVHVVIILLRRSELTCGHVARSLLHSH
jgi:hypothetical protein